MDKVVGRIDELSDDTLLDRMILGFRSFKKDLDPYGIYKSQWIWQRWIRS